MHASLFSLATAKPSGWIHTDYKGSDDTTISILLILSSVMVALLVVATLLWWKWRTVQYFNYCRSFGITSIERGTFQSYVRRLHIDEPALLFEKRPFFDQFLRRVAHLLSSDNRNEQELMKQVELIEIFIKKLPLPSRQPKAFDTYQLKAGQELSITIDDPLIEEESTFTSEVLYINNLYIAIAPPNNPELQISTAHKKSTLQISFAIDKEGFNYCTRLSCSLSRPKAIWLICHTVELEKTAEQEELNLSGIAMILNEQEENVELPVAIESLNTGACYIYTENEKLELDSFLLLNFELKERMFSCRAEVAECLEKPGYYKLLLRGLDDQGRLDLLKGLQQRANK